ncbi:MAG: hypothetical protein QOI53_1966 [Verrucomicrobiota bacterium]|jgi:sugar phosphate isomerase/epimerase|nr:hypothetical protein [Verrucomicrobiota bacterium]
MARPVKLFTGYWDFRSIGHGDINFEDIVVALNDIGYQGPLSIGWEDIRHGPRARRDRILSRRFTPSRVAFDSAFERDKQ